MKNKIISMLLSLLIAFGLWAYVITTVSPGSEETYYNVPVALQNESVLTGRGLIITSLDDPSVNLRLSGNRTDLTKLNSANITVVSDLSRIYEPGKHKLYYDVSYPGDIPDNAISILSHEPDTVTVVVEYLISKTVDVQIEYEGSVADGFICDKENAHLDFETIVVTGPKSIVDQIAHARVKVDLTDKRVSFTERMSFTLHDKNAEEITSNLIETDVDHLELTLKIQRVKEVALEVTVVSGGGATEKTSSIQIKPQKILISGGDAQLEAIDKIVLGTVNLSEQSADTKLTFPIVLPEGVTNETGVSEATVELKFLQLQTETFLITKIDAINVPEGMEAEVITQQLELKIRGPKELISEITEDDVQVVVDFTNAQQGSFTMKPTVILGDKFKDAGAVGTYSVSVTVREADKEP